MTQLSCLFVLCSFHCSTHSTQALGEGESKLSQRILKHLEWKALQVETNNMIFMRPSEHTKTNSNFLQTNYNILLNKVYNYLDMHQGWQKCIWGQHLTPRVLGALSAAQFIRSKKWWMWFSNDRKYSPTYSSPAILCTTSTEKPFVHTPFIWRKKICWFNPREMSYVF